VATNLVFLENVIGHPSFIDGSYTTRFIDETPELFAQVKRQDRATKLLTYIADVSINGHPEARDRAKPPADARAAQVPQFSSDIAAGTRDRLVADGAEAFAKWMRDERRVLVTDTTMRDGHQSLLATRMRSFDLIALAPAYARALPGLLSRECWGGATFDVAMRFLTEDPWERLRQIREAAPNILTQMLLRGSNGVGYTNYPDNVVEDFVFRSAEGGMDLFRVFDCLNWVENMRVSMKAVRDAGKLCEGALCYTGDIHDPTRPKYSLQYYIDLAKELEDAGAHIIGIKDMAGLLKPRAATELVHALREATDLPLHLHTHDTSGIAGATVLAAVEAGVDAVDAAMDAMAGMTSQPALGSLVAALDGSPRETGLDQDAIRQLSIAWEDTRRQYTAFESDLRAPASEVYLHEMPGGQFTNLKEQARAVGLANRWHEVAKTYAEVNTMFGDIVKVTPSSKVVGDMALMMVSQGISKHDVLDPDKDIAFPESVVAMMRGDLGQPPGGWPEVLQAKALKGEDAYTDRPGALLPPADLTEEKTKVEEEIGRTVDVQELASYLMYPKVFVEFARVSETYGPVEVLPTPVYFYGLAVEEEISIELEKGKTLVVRCLGRSDADETGMVRVFFELNGQPRTIKVPDRSHGATGSASRRKADPSNSSHIGAPVPGVISSIAHKAGDEVQAGEPLLGVEAMKMETVIHAEKDGKIAELLVSAGESVDAKDLLIVFEGATAGADDG
ncbi:MAG: pyruvate carboxylase, partial [Pseudomonadota bacterium]